MWGRLGSHHGVWLRASSLLHPAHLWALCQLGVRLSVFHRILSPPAFTHTWRALIDFSSLASWHPQMGAPARISVGRQGRIQTLR